MISIIIHCCEFCNLQQPTVRENVLVIVQYCSVVVSSVPCPPVFKKSRCNRTKCADNVPFAVYFTVFVFCLHFLNRTTIMIELFDCYLSQEQPRRTSSSSTTKAGRHRRGGATGRSSQHQAGVRRRGSSRSSSTTAAEERGRIFLSWCLRCFL